MGKLQFSLKQSFTLCPDLDRPSYQADLVRFQKLSGSRQWQATCRHLLCEKPYSVVVSKLQLDGKKVSVCGSILSRDVVNQANMGLSHL